MPDTANDAAGKEVIRTTCPRDCYDACGIAVIKRDGRITKVLGDPEHPVARGALCGKCALAYNGVWLDPDVRVTTPLRRVGAKGSGSFEPATWNQALSAIADGLKVILADHPAETVVHTHYTGTCSLIAGAFPCRFFHRLGATEVDPDSVCNKAGHVALEATLGDSHNGFDPDTLPHARTLLVWGANPSASGPHAHKHWIGSTDATVIVIDPIAHDTARKADIHLQVRPGADAALAFALTHIARRDNLLDTAFLAEHVLGWQLLESEVANLDLAWAERVTGIPVADMEAVVRAYAPGPSMLWLGQGLQRQPRGGNAFRAICMLMAATGNVGRAGTGLLYLNGGGALGLDTGFLAGPELAPEGGAPSVSHMDLADVLADPLRCQALITWNNNILASSPRQVQIRDALAREDLLTVVVDPFLTDTAKYADWVLPAASFLEFDDLVVPYFHASLLSAQVKVSEPMGDSLPNQEIFRRLARAMGFTDPALFEDDRAMIDLVLGRSLYDGTWEDLAAAGTVKVLSKPHVPFAGGVFPTPSGKIELASEALAEDGHPLLPEPHADEDPADGAVRVLSPASPWLMNSAYGNDPKVLEQLDQAAALVSAADAKRLGIADGAHVVLENATGRVTVRAVVSDRVQAGVVQVPKSPWPAFAPDGLTVNALNPGQKTDFGESSAVHGIQANLRLAG